MRALIAICLLFPTIALAQPSTAFTYQGDLSDQGEPATGLYDFRFRPFDLAGTPLAEALAVEDAPVEDGIFIVTIDFGADIFALGDVLLEIEVRDGESTESFTTLVPRQPVRPVPQALFARKVDADAIDTVAIKDGSVTAAKVDSAEVQRRVTGSCSAGATLAAINLDGTVVCEPPIDTGGFWATDGNSAASGAVLGTLDDQPLELIVDGRPVLRVSDDGLLGSNHAPNIVLGSESASVTSTSRGAIVIAGNSAPDLPCDYPDEVERPCISFADGLGALVAGGLGNRSVATRSATLGGSLSIADGAGSVVAGGTNNHASGIYGFVAGGSANVASGDASFAAGVSGVASGLRSFVAGGSANVASGGGSFAAGIDNQAEGVSSFALGFGARARHDASFVWSDRADFGTTDPNQFLIAAGGGVGINIDSPRAALHVEDTISAAPARNDHVAIIENEASSNGNVLALQTGALLPNGDENYITFFNGVVGDVGAIEGSSGGTGIVFRSGSADFAEMLPLAENVSVRPEPGDIVALVDGRVSLDTAGAPQLLVVTDQAVVLGNVKSETSGRDHVPVSFLGQVPVKVRGPVRPGQWLVASGRADGVATAIDPVLWRAVEHGPIVGEAWAGSSSDGVERVNTGIGLHAVQLTALAHRQQQVIDAQLSRLQDLEAAQERQSASRGRLAARLQLLEARYGAVIETQERQLRKLERRLAVLEAAAGPGDEVIAEAARPGSPR